MSWINDVKDEIKNLDVSSRNLRKFGILVGAVFLILASWTAYKRHPAVVSHILSVAGIVLVALGAILPRALKAVYKIWMGAAFAIGWLTSRFILCVIFLLVIVPIGLVSRLFGKEFLDTRINKSRATYWVKKERGPETNYEKMY